jgi:hypothetical protein
MNLVIFFPLMEGCFGGLEVLEEEDRDFATGGRSCNVEEA